MFAKSTEQTSFPLFSLHNANGRRIETRQSNLLSTRQDVEELLGKADFIKKIAVVHLQLIQQTDNGINEYLGHALVDINTKIIIRSDFCKFWT